MLRLVKRSIRVTHSRRGRPLFAIGINDMNGSKGSSAVGHSPSPKVGWETGTGPCKTCRRMQRLAMPQRRGDVERSRCAFGALPARAARSASCCWARCAAARAACCPPGATSARYRTASTARRTSAGSFELASTRAICSQAFMASARAARALALVRWAGRCRFSAPH